MLCASRWKWTDIYNRLNYNLTVPKLYNQYNRILKYKFETGETDYWDKKRLAMDYDGFKHWTLAHTHMIAV